MTESREKPNYGARAQARKGAREDAVVRQFVAADCTRDADAWAALPDLFAGYEAWRVRRTAEIGAAEDRAAREAAGPDASPERLEYHRLVAWSDLTRDVPAPFSMGIITFSKSLERIGFHKERGTRRTLFQGLKVRG